MCIVYINLRNATDKSAACDSAFLKCSFVLDVCLHIAQSLEMFEHAD